MYRLTPQEEEVMNWIMNRVKPRRGKRGMTETEIFKVMKELLRRISPDAFGVRKEERGKKETVTDYLKEKYIVWAELLKKCEEERICRHQLMEMFGASEKQLRDVLYHRGLLSEATPHCCGVTRGYHRTYYVSDLIEALTRDLA